MASVTTQQHSFSAYTPLQRKTTKPRTRLPICKAQLQPCPTSAVASLASQSKTYASLLACQNTVLGIISEPLTYLIPSETHPPLSIHGLKNENNDLDCHVGATIAAWESSTSSQTNKNQVRWVSASALANAPLGFGTTRLMAWASPHVVCPHFVLELGIMGVNRGRAQGTLSFAQRSDLVLDVEYLDRYYNRKISNVSFNDVYNRCLGFQSTLNWHYYQVPQADMKPVLANSISYTFPAEEESIQAFTDAAADVAQLWAELVIAETAEIEEKQEKQQHLRRWSSERRLAVAQEYDARHEEVVRFDPGNMIAEKLFGKEATENMLGMTVGRF